MPTPVPLDSLLGAAFIGIIISTVIYGINCLQVYLYYAHHCSNDHRLLKTFVAAVITCDTVHVALISAAYYYYVVTKFGDSPALENIVWSLWMQVAIGGCVSNSVQLFFGLRLYHLSGKRIYVPVAISVLCLGQFACLLVYIVDGFKFGSFVHLPPNAPTIAALALGILGDLIIAAGMLFHLRKKRSTFKNTNRGLNLLITYALNTCLLTTLSSAACMISWIMKPHTLIYALFYFILIRLHTCSLMSTLNSREHVRQALGGLHLHPDFINLGAVATPPNQATALFSSFTNSSSPTALTSLEMKNLAGMPAPAMSVV